MTTVKNEQKSYERWKDVPKGIATRNQWLNRGRRVKKAENASAFFEIVTERKLTTVDTTAKVIKQIALFCWDQTDAYQLTPLEQAKRAYSVYFVAPADTTRHIKRCRGGYAIDSDGLLYWDESLAQEGWRQIKELLSQSRIDSHLSGREEFGIYGGDDSCHLLIDLDLHNVPIELFHRRLEVLLDHFHGLYCCHVQVSEEGARGVHLILFFGGSSSLATRRRWINNTFRQLDERHPDILLTADAIKALPQEMRQGVRPVEIYPDPKNGHRLPLARNRIVLLDKPLFPVWRQKSLRQDVVGYVDWLGDGDRQYMPKQEVLDFVDERLNHSCAAKDGASEPNAIGIAASAEISKFRHGDRIPQGELRGKTRGAVVGLWSRSELGPFRHLNSGILTTLQAMHAQGVERSQAIQFVSEFVDQLPDQSICSRLPNKKEEVDQQIRRTADKVWQSRVSSKWQAVASHWAKTRFLVSDKTTWGFGAKTFPIVNLPEVEIIFNNEEKLLLINKLAPVVFGKKQANKPEKQQELFRAVAYFLRYVKGCDREIPQTALPVILSDFDLKLKKNGKSSAFLRCLVKDMGWLYIAAEYDHPFKAGGGTGHRATRYGIGQLIACKFGGSPSSLLNSPHPHMDLYTVSPFLGGDEILNQIPCFEDQLKALNTDQLNL